MASFLRFLIVLWFILIPSNSFAGKQYNSELGGNDLCLEMRNESGSVSNTRCKDIVVSDGMLTESGGVFLLQSGIANGGATSMATNDTVVSTSYTLVKKKISSISLFQQGTLANGKKGQFLTIQITEVQYPGTFTVTPTKATGFRTLLFEAVGDLQTLLYVDDTVGWIPVNNGSVELQN